MPPVTYTTDGGCWSNGKAMSIDWCDVAPFFEKFKRFDFVKVRKHDGSLSFDKYLSYKTNHDNRYWNYQFLLEFMFSSTDLD